MPALRRIAVGALALAGAMAIGVGVWLCAAGVGARRAPGPTETYLARALRHAAISSSGRRLVNPFQSTGEVLQEGRSHFADHCASCHGNDGKGATELGRNLSPRVPDMTARETQALSDGELFLIIKNGVRLTGMPAWGRDTPEDDAASWKLVAFLRHLPAVTPVELEEMKAMNPVSRAELQEQQEIESFLEGDDSSQAPPTPRPAVRHGH
ncbi:MAG TPA: c-type cytochrome [Thermoanaerobaculia bacterium]